MAGLILLLILMLVNRNRYLNVVYTAVYIVILLLTLLSKTFFLQTTNETFNYFLMSAFLFGFIPFVLLTLAVITFFNSKILLEKEGRRPRNLLFSLIGFASLSVLFIYIYYSISNTKTAEQDILAIYVIGLFMYGMLFFSATAVYAVLYNILPSFYKPDYIIVLGSGLIGDRVPPLLASRVREGVKQYKKHGRKPLLIMSGGQGRGELVSEGAAMCKYAIEECGLESHEVITEDKSTSTLENLQFSQEILKERGIKGSGYIVSNNYHVLRAGFYMKEAGLRAIGIGAKTAPFYIPNAFVREFLAITLMHKWLHIILIGFYTIAILLILNGYD